MLGSEFVVVRPSIGSTVFGRDTAGEGGRQTNPFMSSRSYVAGRTEGLCAEALNGRMDHPKDRVKRVPSRPAVPSRPHENLLIAALPAAERRRLLAACK